jgi:hypothetical protein
MFDDVRIEPCRNSRVEVGMTRDVPLAEVRSTTTRINVVDTIQFLDKLSKGTGKGVVGVVLIAMIHGGDGDAGYGNVVMDFQKVILLDEVGAVHYRVILFEREWDVEGGERIFGSGEGG